MVRATATVAAVLLLLTICCSAQPENETYELGPLTYTSYVNYDTTPTTINSVRAGCTSGAPAAPVEELTIALAHEYFLNGTFTCSSLVQAYVQRIAAYNQPTSINTIVTLNPSLGSEAARLDDELQSMMSSGAPLPSLFCVPFIIKDNYDVRGTPTTAGATAFMDNFPFQDSTMIASIKDAGAIILAKSTMSEWAFSAVHSIGSDFGIVRNPYGLDQSTGGSSGGPAAAMAANLGLISFGSDTGSSIRTPSGFQALVGLRPSTGLVSRAGIVPLDFYRDTGGPIGRTVMDVAKVMNVLPGVDPLDTVTDIITQQNVSTTTDYTAMLTPGVLQGKRVGVYMDLAMRPKSDPDVQALFMQAIDDMEAAGAEIVMNVSMKGNSLGDMDFSPDSHFSEWYVGFGEEGHWEATNGGCPLFKESLETYMATAGTHYRTASSIYYDGLIHPMSVSAFQADLTNFNRTEDFPDPSLYSSNVTYNLTCNCLLWTDNPCQGEMAYRFTEMLDNDDLDVVIYPVQNNPPPYIGDWSANFVRNTYLAPETGTPALAVPMGYTPDGLPSGLMVHGRHWDEALVLAVGYGYEQATLHRVPPPSFPECTDAEAYIPYSQVLEASSDSVHLGFGFAPESTVMSNVTSAGRRLQQRRLQEDPDLPVGAGQGSPGDLEPSVAVQERLQGLKQGLRKPKHQVQGAALGAAQHSGYRLSVNN